MKQLLFVQQKLQILHLGKHFDEFSDSYLYAWIVEYIPASAILTGV